MKYVFAIAAAAALPCLAAAQSNYLGMLKPPQAAGPAKPRIYSFSTLPEAVPSPAFVPDSSYRLRLGYKYSRYLAIEGEYNDFARATDIFANPANLSSAFRSKGFGVDTVATLPVWGMSFYGRMGAYRGDARAGFGLYSTSLLGDHATRGTRWRYGLGMRYDITKAFGIRAELERYSPLGSPLTADTEADQFSVGVSWRF